MFLSCVFPLSCGYLFFLFLFFFFFNDTATTEIYTLSLHDALPICSTGSRVIVVRAVVTLRNLLLPVSRTKTSFCVEQITRASLSVMSVAHVVILALPPGVPS